MVPLPHGQLGAVFSASPLSVWPHFSLFAFGYPEAIYLNLVRSLDRLSAGPRLLAASQPAQSADHSKPAGNCFPPGNHNKKPTHFPASGAVSGLASVASNPQAKSVLCDSTDSSPFTLPPARPADRSDVAGQEMPDHGQDLLQAPPHDPTRRTESLVRNP
jgi:hypothetical protein